MRSQLRYAPVDDAPPSLPAAARRVLVILNPTAGPRRRGRARMAIEALEGLGARVVVRETTCRGDAERIVAEAGARDFDVVAAAGGDGTIGEVANGLGRASPPLAIIPLGTANVLASELGLPLDPAAAAGVIAGAQPSPIFTGLADGRRFLQMAGVGFDAHVVEGVSARLKRWTGKGAYVWRMAVELARYPFPEFRLQLDGAPTAAVSAIISKGRFYGGRFTAAPAARHESSSFEVVLFRRAGRVGALRAASALGLDRLSALPEIEIRTARRIVIEGPAGEPVQADGDLIGRLPMRFEIAADPLRILRPESPFAHS